MDKKIFSILLTLSLLMSLASAEFVNYRGAPVMDYIMWGIVTINDEPVEFLELEASNGRTGYSAEIETTNKGEYVFSLGNFLVRNSWELPYACGDEITIKACVGNVGCRETVTLCEDTSVQGGHRIDFDVDERYRPEYECSSDSDCDEDEFCDRRICVKKKYVCEDGTTVSNPDDCPTVEGEYTCPDGSRVSDPGLCDIGREGPMYICWDKSVVADWDECPEKPEEPEKINAWIIATIAGIIAVVAIIFAARYKWGKGFIGLVNYWAKRDPKRALKMLKKAVEKEKAGKYKRG